MTSRTALFPLFLLAALFLSAAAATAARPQTGFLNRTVVVDREVYGYQVYVPAEWTKSKKWPVILFLHGAGERGDDGLQQTQVGIGAAIRKHRDRFPCIVVLTQCRKNSWWSAPAMEAQALKALDQSMREFRGDPDRVYLTGLSMGGYGTWDIAYRYPGRFAAYAPICGGIRMPGKISLPEGSPFAEPGADPYAMVARKIGRTPVWIFHGEADKTVPPSESRKMNEALKAGGGNVKYTEYPGVGHNSWDAAYAEAEFMPWLLAQRLAR